MNETENKKVVTTVKTVSKSKSEMPKISENKEEVSFKDRTAEAAATVALKAAIESSSSISLAQAEKQYFIEKRRNMLKKCKNDREVGFIGQKIFAQYFGKAYTFTYNCIPVTVYFDGVERFYPEFIVKKIQDKISKVSESNTYKEVTEQW